MVGMYGACAFAYAACVLAGSFAHGTASAVAFVALYAAVAFAHWAVLHDCVDELNSVECR